MNETNFEFNSNFTNPWNNLSAGAKVASVLAGLAIAAASVAASLFLAGAALFAAAVFATYRWVSGLTGKSQKDNSVIEAEYAEVDEQQTSN